ncbi:hypothetical protein MMC28_007033 [Mycoblastus sanguinarius]|nr:hypothetical protein [Mycoblastus sanguinarius]
MLYIATARCSIVAEGKKRKRAFKGQTGPPILDSTEVFDMLSARMYLTDNNQQAGIEGPSLAMVNSAIVADRTLDVIWNMEDLNRAVEVAKTVVAVIQPDHPDRAHHFNNLGTVLYRRFEQTGIMDEV